MPDTDAPWRIPYPVGGDRADDPTQSQARAFQIHNCLNTVQGQLDSNAQSINSLQNRMATVETRLDNLIAGLPTQINNGILNFGPAQAYVGRDGDMVVPAVNWGLVPYDVDRWNNTSAGVLWNGSWYCKNPGFYLCCARATLYTNNGTEGTYLLSMKCDPFGIYSTGINNWNRAGGLSGSAVGRLGYDTQVQVSAAISQSIAASRCISMSVWLVRLGS